MKVNRFLGLLGILIALTVISGCKTNEGESDLCQYMPAGGCCDGTNVRYCEGMTMYLATCPDSSYCHPFGYSEAWVDLDNRAILEKIGITADTVSCMVPQESTLTDPSLYDCSNFFPDDVELPTDGDVVTVDGEVVDGDMADGDEDGDVADGDVPDGDMIDGDADGDATDGDEDGDVADGDATDGDADSDATDGDATDGDVADGDADGDVIDGDATDGDIDTDATDSEIDGDLTDSELEIDGDLEEAEAEAEEEALVYNCPNGVCLDETTGLEWQEIAPDESFTLAEATTYCENLDLDGGGWRVPNISELRSIVRNCEKIEIGGWCRVYDNCSVCGEDMGEVCTDYTCRDVSCAPVDCPYAVGPADGCYWMDGLQGPCSSYQSSTYLGAGDTTEMFVLHYIEPRVAIANDYFDGFVRCVRGDNPIVDGDEDADEELIDGDLVEAEAEEEAIVYNCPNGVCLDEATGLEWQEVAEDQWITLAEATTYCSNLALDGGGWRVPNVSELRSIMRNCTDIEVGGACRVYDNCSVCGDDMGAVCININCWDAGCYPDACSDDGGPTGCYWMDDLQGPCSAYQSSTEPEGSIMPDIFIADFQGGQLYYSSYTYDHRVRCVRGDNPIVDGDEDIIDGDEELIDGDEEARISCDGLPNTFMYAGCCKDGNAYYCGSDNYVFQNTCEGEYAGCGWFNPFELYDCGLSGADPSNTYPIECPF